MKKYILPLILILFLTFSLIGDSADWLSGWDKRIELAIGDYADDIGAEVVWFPVTIFLKDANGDSTKVFLEVGANSRKIALTKADGTTELKGEIEGWNYDAGTPANSTGFIHTSATGWTINANTSIWLYYDNDHADNANVDVINTAAGAAVWDGNFIAVYHMVDDNGNTDDSTSNNVDLTKASAGNPAEATGKVGQGQDFSSDYMTHATFLDVMPDDLTVEAIINLDVVNLEWQRLVYKTNIGGQDRIVLEVEYDKITFWGEAANGGIKEVTSTNTVATGTWYYIAGVHTHGAALKVYLDTAVDSGETLGTILDGTAADIYIGASSAVPFEPLDGIMDELRFSSTPRAAAWLKGTKNTLWDALFTYGSEESIEVTVNAILFGTNF